MTVWMQIATLSTVLSLIITYAWWTRLRVWNFREDLFEIRDRLWDEMFVAGTLDHPDHVRVRKSINSYIRLAPMMSIVTLSLLHASAGSDEKPIQDITLDPVQDARIAVYKRLLNYVVKESLLGSLTFGVFSIFFWGKLTAERLMYFLESSRGTAEVRALAKLV